MNENKFYLEKKVKRKKTLKLVKAFHKAFSNSKQ